METDLKNKTIEELAALVAGLGQKRYLAKYIFTFIHAKDVDDIARISPLSKSFREELIEKGFYISRLKIAEKFIDPDGTIKYLFELADGNFIESVLLFDKKRKTLCVSTQVGCAINCTFCATGKLGFVRNLTAAEIVDQVNAAVRDKCDVTNIVYMGMGEPLQNYDAVLKSVRILNDQSGKNFGVRHQTISTCGIAPAIRKLAAEDIKPRLAISLNATTDPVRDRLMPINKKYPIAELLKAVSLYQARTKLRVTFEYILIAQVNDGILDAERLAKKLKGFNCNVNLIEYNPHPGCDIAASDSGAINIFAEILERGGIKVAIRRKMGQKIKAACGQLGSDRLKK